MTSRFSLTTARWSIGNGSSEYKVAALKKSIYSLTDLDEQMAAACGRYLDFVGTLEDCSAQRHDLDHISRPARLTILATAVGAASIPSSRKT